MPSTFGRHSDFWLCEGLRCLDWLGGWDVGTTNWHEKLMGPDILKNPSLRLYSRDVSGIGSSLHYLRCGGSEVIKEEGPSYSHSPRKWNRLVSPGRVGALVKYWETSKAAMIFHLVWSLCQWLPCWWAENEKLHGPEALYPFAEKLSYRYLCAV